MFAISTSPSYSSVVGGRFGLQNLEFENHKVLLEYLINVCTLRFQLQDTVLLFGTVLSLYPVHFRKYVSRLLIGSMLNFEAFLGAPFYRNNLAPIKYVVIDTQ